MRTNLLTTILVALAGCNYDETEACISAPADGTCPPSEDVDPDDMFSFDWCEVDVKEVSGSGSLEGSPWTDTGSDEAYCCYPVVARDADPGCAVGRPFTEDDAPVVAPIRPGTGWAADASGSPDAALCEAWKRTSST